MTLTDHDGQALTPEDLAFLRAHPRLARLAVKAQKLEDGTGTPEDLIAETLLRWATALLPDPKGSYMSFDFLGDLLGKARRRRLETQARQDAQAALDANKDLLVSLVMQTVNAMPSNAAPAELHLIAGALLSQALGSSALLARVPPAARPALSAAVAQALAGVPAPDPNVAAPLAGFQVAAKVAIAQAVRALTL